MIAGHFGLAAAVKSREPGTPLWALMLATVWLDVVFVPLFVAGVETTELVSTGRSGYGASVIHANLTHSLVGALLLSQLLGLLAGWRWGTRAGVVVTLVAASHWVLDLVVHRADMPILPANLGGFPLLGLGVWRYPLLSLGLEGALVLVGAVLYWRAAKAAVQAQRRGGRAASAAAVLIAVFGIIVVGMDFTAH